MVGTLPEHRGEVKSVTSTVRNEVASHEGVDPLERSTPLNDAVDPGPLEALRAGPISGERREDDTVEFRCHGYDVATGGNGGIDIRNG